jgi:phosphoglucomutase
VNEKPFTVEVIDTVHDYMEYMKEIFDFDLLKQFLPTKGVIVNALNGGMLAVGHRFVLSPTGNDVFMNVAICQNKLMLLKSKIYKVMT